jgi:hypothetical protein
LSNKRAYDDTSEEKLNENIVNQNKRFKQEKKEKILETTGIIIVLLILY